MKNIYSIKNVVEKNTSRSIEDLIRDFLYKTRTSRYYNSSGHKNAQNYISDFLLKNQKYGAKLSVDEFEESGKKGINYIFEKEGSQKENEMIVIFCYYDTNLNDVKKNNQKLEMPGADNNATGVVVSLLIAELISKLDLKKTVRIVFLDLEEYGNLGSIAYLKKYGQEKEQMFIALQTLGHDSKNNDKTKKIGNFKAYTKIEEVNRYKEYFDVSFKAYPFVEFRPDENFPNFGPAKILKDSKNRLIVFSENLEDDPNPRIRTSNDFIETLNISAFYNSYKSICTFLLGFNYSIVK